MTLQQLKYVITVAETGSITEAVRKLFISQPSLSSALKEICGIHIWDWNISSRCTWRYEIYWSRLYPMAGSTHCDQ